MKKKIVFAFKPLENHVILVLSYVSCTFYGKPPRIIPPFAHKSHLSPIIDLTLQSILFASTI
jgi:hypothetical protein